MCRWWRRHMGAWFDEQVSPWGRGRSARGRSRGRSGAPREDAGLVAQGGLLAEVAGGLIRVDVQVGVEVDDGPDGEVAGGAAPGPDLLGHDRPVGVGERRDAVLGGVVAEPGDRRGGDVGVEHDRTPGGEGDVVAVLVDATPHRSASAWTAVGRGHPTRQPGGRAGCRSTRGASARGRGPATRSRGPARPRRRGCRRSRRSRRGRRPARGGGCSPHAARPRTSAAPRPPRAATGPGRSRRPGRAGRWRRRG